MNISGARTGLFLDFDGTCFQTFEDSPNGWNVNNATEQAVIKVFGNRGLERYKSIGGLQNKAPSELVLAMYPFQSLNYLTRCTDELVAQKLAILTPELGTKLPDGRIWPTPTNGFIEFWQQLEQLKEIGIPIDRGIISSGHNEFIEATFRNFGLTLPDITVTEDDIRHRRYPKEMERRVKPGTWPFAYAHYKWLHQQQLENKGLDLAQEARDHMIFFGDSIKSDGGMAERSRVVFGHYNINTTFSTLVYNRSFTFNDWRDIGILLNNQSHRIVDGKPIRDIFFTTGLNPESGIRYNKRERY